MNVSATADGMRRGYVDGPEDQRLRLVERIVDLGDEGRYLVAVAGDSAEIEEETRNFDRALVITFGTLLVVLFLTTMFQVRFGLAPLKRISEALAAIRAGTAERLEGRFPVEIEPLARETNALIEANREIVERARTHVGNLAHALKTPLSVMVNEARRAAGRSACSQNARTDRHHARPGGAPSRARAHGGAHDGGRHGHGSAAGGVRRSPAPWRRSTTGATSRSMSTAPTPVRFRGEQPDLEEMAGNLLDNACKWAQSRVNVEVIPEFEREQAEFPHHRR